MPAPDKNRTTNSDFEQWQHKALLISTLSGADNAYGVLAIDGIDSAKFLQGQLTCNVQDITPQQAKPGAHCTHKGRMVANFQLLQYSEQHYLFVLPQETLGALQKSLAKYIVFSKAKLRDASAEFSIVGISGTQATIATAALLGTTPDQLTTAQYAQCTTEKGIAICMNTEQPRYLCLLPTTSAEQLLQALPASAISTDCHYWHWLDIRDGMGNVRAQTIEEFIPQMLNLQQLDGISFTKGCYTGQEIVARMQYRGILKKAMYRIAGSGNAPLPNTALHQADHEQAIGHIVMAENINTDQWQALAVINHDAANQPMLLSGHAQPATTLPLPYATHPEPQ